MLKINLDELNLSEIIRLINDYETIIFYNDLNGKTLNKEKILKLLMFFEKYNKGKKYYFYNIPFCFFKKFGRNFIDKHCIRNRLCNYYEGYVTYNKCNKCRYGLFCNNFNSNIPKNELIHLTGFYQEIVNKEYLFKIIYKYYNFIESLGYKNIEIGFYSTQKYITEFLDGEIEYIAKDFLNYLTLYFLLNNKLLSNSLFETLESFTLILKNKEIEYKLNNLIKDFGVNLNFTIGQGINNKKYIFDNNNFNLDYFLSREKYNGKKDFFDYTNSFILDNNIRYFYGKLLNGINNEIINNVKIIQKASDLFLKQSEIYIGRDILSGINLNNYKAILISSDGLGDKGRLVQSIKSIKIPVIYNIEPDLTLYLKDGDKIKINLRTGKIVKI